MRKASPVQSLRRHLSRRLAPLGLLVFALAGCASDAPQDTLKPEGPFARKIDALAKPVFYVSIAVGVFIYALIAICVVKFRRRSEDDVPVQIHGSTPLEIGWTVLPALLLVVFGVLSVGRIFELSEEPKDAYHITVIGHRWWWEYHYPQAGKTELSPELKVLKDPDTGTVTGGNVVQSDPVVVTAGELHIPTNTNVRLTIVSDDVMHNYWVPKLGGKIYAIPGRFNKLSIRADHAETYYGQCAEFCGISHANMRFKVVAQERADFDAWLANESGAALEPVDGTDAALGQALFTGTGGCQACHSVASDKATEIAGKIGPNLAHIGVRKTFAGAINEFNKTNLRAWLRDPQAVKPGSRMKIGKLTEDQITQLIAYLESLK